MYRRSKVRWQSGLLSSFWSDRGSYCTTFPEIAGALQLCRFPRWPPNNLSSQGAHRELWHCCLLILYPLDKSEWENFQSMGSFHIPLDETPSGKFVRTMRLIVTSATGHGNFAHFSDVLICYCLVTAWRRGRLWSLREAMLTEHSRLRSRHGDYGCYLVPKSIS